MRGNDVKTRYVAATLIVLTGTFLVISLVSLTVLHFSVSGTTLLLVPTAITTLVATVYLYRSDWPRTSRAATGRSAGATVWAALRLNLIGLLLLGLTVATLYLLANTTFVVAVPLAAITGIVIWRVVREIRAGISVGDDPADRV